MLRISLRTLALTLVSMVWGAAIYAALFAVVPPPPEPRCDEELAALLLKAAEQRRAAAKRLEKLENSETPPPLPPTGNENRRLKEHVEPVWRPSDPGGGARFTIREPFNFPLSHYSLSKRELLGSQWVRDLQSFLRSVRGRQVSLVTASVEHLDVLLNWLISANLIASPPLQNVLVLTLDKSVFDLTSQREIPTLFVNEKMVISPSANVTRRFSQVHVVRLSILRLVNHYGYSVVNYDCDAILLKNPQPIFDGHKDADLIGTFGKGPGQLYVKWGITLNTGVMLLRSNSKIGG